MLIKHFASLVVFQCTFSLLSGSCSTQGQTSSRKKVDPAGITQEANRNISFGPGCTERMRQRLTMAYEYGSRLVTMPAFRKELVRRVGNSFSLGPRDPYAGESNERFIERVMDVINSRVQMKVECKDLNWFKNPNDLTLEAGEAIIAAQGIPRRGYHRIGETADFVVDLNFAHEVSIIRLANILWHEAMHRNGYDHYDDHLAMDVPYGVGGAIYAAFRHEIQNGLRFTQNESQYIFTIPFVDPEMRIRRSYFWSDANGDDYHATQAMIRNNDPLPQTGFSSMESYSKAELCSGTYAPSTPTELFLRVEYVDNPERHGPIMSENQISAGPLNCQHP